MASIMQSGIIDLITICRGHRVFIQTHNIPDPDAIGSAFGLQQLMKHLRMQMQLSLTLRHRKLLMYLRQTDLHLVRVYLSVRHWKRLRLESRR